MLNESTSVQDIIEREGFSSKQDLGSLESKIKEILENHHGEVERFLNGEEKLIGFFMGLVMRETKGKEEPEIIKKILGLLLKK